MTGRPLPSWREGPARQAILEYLARATGEGTDHVPRPARVAVFDNDGTLWCERPAYVQALFIVERLRTLRDRPEIAANPAAGPLLAGDLHGALAHGFGAVAELLVASHAGLTADEFADEAARWLDEATHPRFGRRFVELVYQPMRELLDLLRSHDFRVFVVTGGGVEFVRATSEAAYGVPPDGVVGSAVRLEFERRDDRVELVRQAAILGSPNEGPPKPINIQGHVGRRPVMAAGNTAGDLEMLEYAASGRHASLCLVVEHDDPVREYAYPGASVTDPDAPALAEVGRARGWTVVSMRDDWSYVFAGDAA